MARQIATDQELNASAKRLWSDANATTGDTSVLLRFYSVECWMKFKYLCSLTLPAGTPIDTAQLGNAFGPDGHNLEVGARSLTLPAAIGTPPQLVVGSSTVHIKEAHQVWRYGIGHSGSTPVEVWLLGVSAVLGGPS